MGRDCRDMSRCCLKFIEDVYGTKGYFAHTTL